MAHWMITCKEHSKLVSEAMDRTLPCRSRMAMKLHQWICSPCRFFNRQMNALRTACREKSPKLPPDLSDPTIPADVCARIKTELEKLSST
jgi:hypothetical protein